MNGVQPHLYVSDTRFRADEDDSTVPVHCFPTLRPADVDEAVRSRDEDIQGQNVSLHRFFAWILRPINRYAVEILCLLPKLALTLTPISLLTLHMSPLATRLLSQRKQKCAQYGYLSLDKTRKVMCLLDRDPQCKTLPIVGIWTDIPDQHEAEATFDHPIVWEASARFILDPFLQKVFVDDATYLIMVIYKADGNRRGYRFFEAKFAHGSADVIFGATVNIDSTSKRQQTVNLDVLPHIEFDGNSPRVSQVSKLEMPRREPKPHQMMEEATPSTRRHAFMPDPSPFHRDIDDSASQRQLALSTSWSPDALECKSKRPRPQRAPNKNSPAGDGLWVMFQMQQEHLKVIQQQIFDLTDALSRSSKTASYSSRSGTQHRTPKRDAAASPFQRSPSSSDAPTTPLRDACTDAPNRRNAQTSCSFSSSPLRHVERLENQPDVRSSFIKTMPPAQRVLPPTLEENIELQNAPYDSKSVRPAASRCGVVTPVRKSDNTFAFESALIPSSPRSDLSDKAEAPILSVVPPSVTGALRARNLAAQATDVDEVEKEPQHRSPIVYVGANDIPRIRYQASATYSGEYDLSDIDEESDDSDDERVKAIMRKYAPKVRY